MTAPAILTLPTVTVYGNPHKVAVEYTDGWWHAELAPYVPGFFAAARSDAGKAVDWLLRQVETSNAR